jgi:hypothetical protein
MSSDLRPDGFRFGAYLTESTDRAGLISRCRLFEELGYDVISPTDHLSGLSPVAATMIAARRPRTCGSGRWSSTQASTTRCCSPAMS